MSSDESSRQSDAPSAISAKLMIFLGCAFIVIACFAAYSPAIKGGFVWDDDKYVTANPLLPAHDGLWRIWFSTDVPSQYFPLAYTTFWLEYQRWGPNPLPYHITNVAIHIISSLLLWLVLRRLLIPAAFVIAAIFALHPVNVESVAWISERKNVLMLVFAMLSVLFYIEFALRSKTTRRAVVFYLLSLFCYVLSLFSKTTACVLPVVLILILWLKRAPLNKSRLFQVAPYFVFGFAMGLLTIWWERHHQLFALINLGLSPLQRFLIAARALWFYAAKIFLPVNLAFSYPRWKIDTCDPLQYVWPIACVLIVSAFWFGRKRLGRGPIAALFIFVAALFPMLGFFGLYTFVYTWVADHYQYMACIALIALVVSAGRQLLIRLGAAAVKSAPLIVAVLLLVFATLTWRQSGAYANIETLWRDTLRKNPDSWLAHNNLSRILLAQNKLDEAISHLTRSLELLQNAQAVHPYNVADAHFNLALALRARGRYQDAIEHLRHVLDIRPNDREADYNLRNILELQGRLKEAGKPGA